MNFVLKSASKATAALNGLPCLLLKPLRTPVLPFASRSVISVSVSVLPAIWRNTGRAQSGLSQAHHLAVELHRARAALGAGAARCLVTKDFVAGEQFRGYLAGVALDVTQESLVRCPAFFYLRQFRLPAPGHFHVGDVHAFHDGIQGKALSPSARAISSRAPCIRGRSRVSMMAARVAGVPMPQSFNALPRFLVLHALASGGLHCRQQGAFRVQRLRTGHARTHRAAVHRQRVALLPVGQYGVLPVLAIDRNASPPCGRCTLWFQTPRLRTPHGRWSCP